MLCLQMLRLRENLQKSKNLKVLLKMIKIELEEYLSKRSLRRILMNRFLM
jgi:hypothetical protein